MALIMAVKYVILIIDCRIKIYKIVSALIFKRSESMKRVVGLTIKRLKMRFAY